MDIYEACVKLNNMTDHEWDNNSGEIPCYCDRISVSDDYIRTAYQAKQFIRLARQTRENGLVMFSVTEKDACHKEFLKAARGFKCATIIETRSDHGPYSCWMIILPAAKK